MGEGKIQKGETMLGRELRKTDVSGDCSGGIDSIGRHSEFI